LKDYRTHQHLHSFPTRRSSDLGKGAQEQHKWTARTKTGTQLQPVGEPSSVSRCVRPAPCSVGDHHIQEEFMNCANHPAIQAAARSEEHTSELQSRTTT